MEYIVSKDNIDRLIHLILDELQVKEIEINYLNNLIHLISWNYCKEISINCKDFEVYMIINIDWNYKLSNNRESLIKIYNQNNNIQIFQKSITKKVKLIDFSKMKFYDENNIKKIIKEILNYELINLRSEYYIYQTYPFETVKYWTLDEPIDFLNKAKKSKVSFYNFIQFL